MKQSRATVKKLTKSCHSSAASQLRQTNVKHFAVFAFLFLLHLV